MAVLKHLASGRQLQLQPRHVVGRSRSCTLSLPDTTVSGEHATVFWGEEGWRVRDLGSRNGTWVAGTRLSPGVSHPLPAGGTVSFGTDDDPWQLEDASPPLARAVAVDGLAIDASDGVLAVPDSDTPSWTVHRSAEGTWLLEDDDSVRVVVDGEEVTVDGRTWTLHLPVPLAGTEKRAPSAAREPELCFRVSTDGEYVELDVVDGPARTSLGARAHHEILLALARARLDDARPQVLASDRGWVYVDDLKRMLRADAAYLRVGIFRARRQLAGAGVHAAEQIVERRVSTGQIRLGTERVSVQSL